MNKNQKLVITVPKPCHEDWEKMSVVEKGRYCAACRKTVIDFTVMTDTEMSVTMKNSSNQSICGRFFASQLNRELILTQSQSPLIFSAVKRIAASFLLLQVTVSSALAQSHKGKQPAAQHAGSHKRDVQDNTEYLSGRVLDYNTGKPLDSIQIHIKECPSLTAITDRAGRFKIILPDWLDTSRLTLQPASIDSASHREEGYLIPDKTINNISREIVLFRYVEEAGDQLIIHAYRKPIEDRERYDEVVHMGGPGLPDERPQALHKRKKFHLFSWRRKKDL